MVAGVAKAMLASSEIKAYLLVGSFLSVASLASAEDTLINGGRSTHGKYEVRLVRTDGEPSDYDIQLYNANKPFFTLDGTGGYLGYAAAVERDRAIWHPSGKFVAITDQGTRHSREIYLVAISPKHADTLKLPDYVQNALGRVHATSADFICVSTPQRWDGDDLVIKFDFSANLRRSYTCEVILRVLWGEHNAPTVQLRSVGNPKEQDG